jgi:hypothetical protein
MGITVRRAAAGRHVGRAWVAIALALGIHVLDEALTGFLGVYNPTAQAIRARLPWLPLPVFNFRIWLWGLIAAVTLLLLLSPLAFRGYRWTRWAGYGLALMMLLNGALHTLGTAMGHTVPSVQFKGPMPGFYSAPLLVAAAIYMFRALRSTRTGWSEPGPIL